MDMKSPRNQITWTIEVHEKFLEAVGALGGTSKHRLRHRNAKPRGQRQESATRILIPDLNPSVHDEATSESITPRVETHGEVYPLRMWTEVKKRSADTAALKTDMYTCTSRKLQRGVSVCVGKYENNLHRVFSEKKKHWQFMSEHRWPWKNNIVITAEGDPNEAYC